jgi:hypothetical protein
MFDFVNVFVCGKINVANYQNNNRLCSNWQLTSFLLSLKLTLQIHQTTMPTKYISNSFDPLKNAFLFFIRSLDFFFRWILFQSFRAGQLHTERSETEEMVWCVCFIFHLFIFHFFFFCFCVFFLFEIINIVRKGMVGVLN